MRIMTFNASDDIAEITRCCRDETPFAASAVKETVTGIIQTVRQDKDAAVKQYTQQFDGYYPEELSFSDTKNQWQQADTINKDIQQAIEVAYQNIWQFHTALLPHAVTLDQNGLRLTREYRPIERVGLYIPNGTAPLFSALLMLAIPAVIAGCKEIVVTTPPNKDSTINPVLLYAARRCGIRTLYKAGGAQAIAALAYGTETIPKVQKIFGPGNQYVTEAKLQVSCDPKGAAIDLPAGPSEVLIIADSQGRASFIASDLLAQAEHDTNSRSILLTTDINLAKAVAREIELQLDTLDRKAIAQQSLEKSVIIVAPDLDTCVRISNDYAPEHLILNVDNPQVCLNKITNAGAVFIGPWSAEALGDYACGPNHVLPTQGYAKSYSGLGPESFMKAMTFQEITAQGLLNLAPCVELLAELEGLSGHKNSVTLRRTYLQESSDELA